MATGGSHGACIEGAVSFGMLRKMYRIQYQWRSQARRTQAQSGPSNDGGNVTKLSNSCAFVHLQLDVFLIK